MKSEETILHHLLKRRENSKNDTAIQFKDSGKWVKYTWADYYSLIEAIGAGLLKYGVNRSDAVAIMSGTRPEWIIADLAIMGVGGVTVPIYPNNLEEDVEFILNNAQVKVFIVENKSQYEKWIHIKSKCPSVQQVIILDTKNEQIKDALSWSELLNNGRSHLISDTKMFIDQAKMSKLSDLASILYTSGTTGRPKGVSLTHEQIMSELEDIFTLVTVTTEDSTLSFLPYSHVLGRVEAWGNVYAGYTLNFAENIDRLKANLGEIQPTFMIAVPRIFEKIYAGILAQIETSRIKRRIFRRAQSVGNKVSDALQNNLGLSIPLALEYEVAKKLVFNNIMKALGGRMRFAVSGGAPLSSEIAKFFHGAGLLICEGYGLTETTAGVSFNSPFAYKFGSVGKPLADVNIKIAADGEILVKSKKVMKEYYQNPDATNEVMEEGFFKTGDIGHIDDEGFIFITDRKKDLIKTAGGKYVAPQKLENLLKLNPNISNVLIHGDQKKYIVALVTLQPHLRGKESDHETFQVIKDAVAEVNEQLASYESIKKFAILPHDFTVESGELTPSLKVKRKFCDKKFAKIIDELY